MKGGRSCVLFGVLCLWWQCLLCHGFFIVSEPRLQTTVKRPQRSRSHCFRSSPFSRRSSATIGFSTSKVVLLRSSASGYVPPSPKDSVVTTTQKKGLWPKVGDIVRFYDVDGGDERGQVLVGRISFIQTNLGKEGSGWSVEIAELDDVGSGYFADYPFQKRGSKRRMRDLGAVSPIAASFVRSEGAHKVPVNANGLPQVRAESYDIDTYPGPFAGEDAVNKEVVRTDGEIYSALKSNLLRYSALAGLAGTVLTDLSKGLEDSAIYFAGVVASLLYLFLLTIKTDTVASQEAKLGSNVANLRFLTPLIVLVGIAFYNKSLGDANPVLGLGPFATVTAEQFAAAVLGFLTYRVPLFLIQITDAFRNTESGELVLPGSVGVAMQLAKDDSPQVRPLTDESDIATIFLVSGPQATGRTDLVNRLIEEGKGKYARPKMVDGTKDPATFERLERRGDLLFVDPLKRYGLTRDGILSSAKECAEDSVLVIDADVALVKKLKSLAGVRLIGVWVGLSSVDDFETRLCREIDSGAIAISEDESRESVIRARIREIVQEIEYGISCGIFEFTIINQDEDESLKQLREAAAYCFK